MTSYQEELAQANFDVGHIGNKTLLEFAIELEKTIKTKLTKIETSPEEFDNLMQHEKEYKPPKKLSDFEAIKIFPEFKESLPQKIEEFEEEYKIVKAKLKEQLSCVDRIQDDVLQNLARKWVELSEDTKRATFLKDKIRLFKYFINADNKTVNDTHLSESDIMSAKETPLTGLVERQISIRSVGNGRYKGKCPFHNEKNPSFTIFENNKFKCFGCQKTGDSIDYVMLTQGLNFPQAVRQLIDE